MHGAENSPKLFQAVSVYCFGFISQCATGLMSYRHVALLVHHNVFPLSRIVTFKV